MKDKIFNHDFFNDDSRLHIIFTSAMREAYTQSNEFWELIYIYEGRGIFYHDNTELEVNAGELLLIKAGKEFTIVSPTQKNNAPARICRCFFNQEYFDEIKNEYCNIFKSENCALYDMMLGKHSFAVRICDDDAQNIHNILWLIAHEHNHFKVGSEAIIKNSLLNLFICATRLYEYQLHSILPTYTTNKSLDELKKYIRANFSCELSLEFLASLVHLSREHLSRTFKEYTGQTISAFLLDIRIESAKKLLHNPRNSITEISEYCGYKTIGSFQRAFKKHTGMAPREYRKAVKD